MTRYDKMNDARLANAICGRLCYDWDGDDIYSGKNRDHEIWTQLGSDEEGGKVPACNIDVGGGKVKVIADETHILLLDEYDLTNRAGFMELIDDINTILYAYYEQFEEQPQFVEKGYNKSCWVLTIKGVDDDYATIIFDKSNWTVEKAMEDPDGLKQYLGDNGCPNVEVSVYEFGKVDPKFVSLMREDFMDWDNIKQRNFYCIWE